MWLRSTSAKRPAARNTPPAPHLRRTTRALSRTVPAATRSVEHSGSDDEDRTGKSVPATAHHANANVVGPDGTETRSRIAHMIAPLDDGARADTRGRRPNAPALPMRNAQRGINVVGPTRVSDGSDERKPGSRKMQQAVGHCASRDARQARARASPVCRTAARNDRQHFDDNPIVAQGPAKSRARTPQTQHHDRNLKVAAPFVHRDAAREEAHDRDVADRAKRPSRSCSETDGESENASNTGNNTDSDKGADYESEDGDDESESDDGYTVDWANAQIEALARVRSEITSEQRRTTFGLADALLSLRTVMERARATGRLVSPAAVADVEARARAFLRLGCYCPWEPAAAPLGLSLRALVAQLAIDRPQEPTPCFVALLEALAAAVRLIAASHDGNRPPHVADTAVSSATVKEDTTHHGHTIGPCPDTIARAASDDRAPCAHQPTKDTEPRATAYQTGSVHSNHADSASHGAEVRERSERDNCFSHAELHAGAVRRDHSDNDNSRSNNNVNDAKGASSDIDGRGTGVSAKSINSAGGDSDDGVGGNEWRALNINDPVVVDNDHGNDTNDKVAAGSGNTLPEADEKATGGGADSPKDAARDTPS